MVNKICLFCKKRNKREKYQFCSKRCTNRAAKKAPELLRVPKDHVMYKDVASSFGKTWDRHKGKRPIIARIYLITWTPKLRKSFDDYRTHVARKLRGSKKPKEVKRFRCETRSCRLGDPEKSKKLCKSLNCNLCRAIQTGFRLTLQNKRNNVGQLHGSRFGRGIYMAPSSSKAFQYAENSNRQSKYKAVLATRVVLGNPQMIRFDNFWNSYRLAPDPGYDSIEAHPPNGPTEVVVFDYNAARPAYLIITK